MFRIDKKVDKGLPRAKAGKNEEWQLIGMGFLLGDENVLKLIVVTVVHPSEYSKKHWIGRAQGLTPVIPAPGRPRWMDHEVRRPRSSWLTWWNPVSTKNTKISHTWWRLPIISATREAETGELLEPGRQSLQWAEIGPLHSSLGDTEDSASKNRKVLTFATVTKQRHTPFLSHLLTWNNTSESCQQ